MREDLWRMSRRDLMGLLRRGRPIDPASLCDWEYRGVSLGLPRALERLSWKTFKKVFHRDPSTGGLRGWNVRLSQTGVLGPSVPLRSRAGVIETFGHYEVRPLGGYHLPCPIPSGLMLDYGCGGRALGPLSRLRDPIVAVNAGDDELLLGWSYLDLYIARLSTPSFFSLERDCALSHRVEAPRGMLSEAPPRWGGAPPRAPR